MISTITINERSLYMKNQKQIFTLTGADGNDQRYTTNESGKLIPLVEDKEPIVKAVYSPNEAMEITGLSRNTFMNLLYSGQLKGIKAGRRWLISSQALNNFLNPVN